VTRAKGPHRSLSSRRHYYYYYYYYNRHRDQQGLEDVRREKGEDVVVVDEVDGGDGDVADGETDLFTEECVRSLSLLV